MEKLKIALQGVPGAFHEIAARNYFQGADLEIIACESFAKIFQEMERDSSVVGIMAIENTIAGSLLQNHTLLSGSEFKVVGEYKLRIEHNLVALPGQEIGELREVHSHPIALMQCEEFLERNKHLKVVESSDTAVSAREIADGKIKGQAAICSSLAASMYGLEILSKGIETNKHNFTRFLILGNKGKEDSFVSISEKNKASLMLTVPHEEGSLSQILTILSFYKMNLSKIQSLPIIGREWEYRFYIDLVFEDYAKYQQALSAVMPLVREFKILGEYKKC